MTVSHKAAALLMVAVATPSAPAVLVDFESLTPNQSVNGQGGWTVEDSFGNSAELFDEAVVDDGTGNQVWRVANSTTSGSLSNQPYSQKSPAVAGETGAGLYNDFGTNHTMPNNPVLSSATAASSYFHGSFDFKSATGAAQSGSLLSVSAAPSQSNIRQSYISIEDTGSGYDIGFVDTTGASFNQTTLVSGLSYSDWHNVSFYIEFVDGLDPGAMGNDIVNVLVNGSLVHTGTTWESYYDANPGTFSSPQAVDSLVFPQRGTAALGTLGNGLFIDNVEISNAAFAAIPEASAFLCVGLAFVGACLQRGRRSSGGAH